MFRAYIYALNICSYGSIYVSYGIADIYAASNACAMRERESCGRFLDFTVQEATSARKKKKSRDRTVLARFLKMMNSLTLGIENDDAKTCASSFSISM